MSDRADAERRFDAFFAAVDCAQIQSFKAFADGVRLWREELLAYIDEPTSNRYGEGVTNKVKVITPRLRTADLRSSVAVRCPGPLGAAPLLVSAGGKVVRTPALGR